MITVHATRLQADPFRLEQIKIRKESIEIMQDLGSCSCATGSEPFDGPICRVIMTSGRVLYINATSAELEAQST